MTYSVKDLEDKFGGKWFINHEDDETFINYHKDASISKYTYGNVLIAYICSSNTFEHFRGHSNIRVSEEEVHIICKLHRNPELKNFT